MSEVVNHKISDLGDTVTGKTPSSNNPEDFGDAYLFVTPTDSFDSKYISKTERCLSEVGVRRLKSKMLPPKSIMVTCIGSAMGKVALNKSTCITNQQINSIRVNKVKFDPDYIYYALCNNYRILRNASTGSTALPLLNKTDFDELKIPVHKHLPYQQKIASVLAALDAKIELNNRINAELEAMAKTLYDYWFVQFDFPFDFPSTPFDSAQGTSLSAGAQGKPEKNGKPYKSSVGKMVWNKELKREIPEGWKTGSLVDLGDIVGGSTPTTTDQSNFSEIGTPWITPKDLANNSGNKFISRGELGVTDQGLKSASLKIYPKNTVLLSSRAPIGYMAIARNPVTTNQGFKSIIPSKGFSPHFIYYTLKNSMNTIVQYASGSTFKEVSGSVLKTVLVCLPPNPLVETYTKTVSSIFARQDILE
jgi:type I restriction enzyme S subunit